MAAERRPARTRRRRPCTSRGCRPALARVKSVKSGSENQPVRVEGHAAHEVPERRAEQHRQQRAGAGEDGVPGRAPQRVVDVAAELDRDPAEDQRPEHEEDREVEARQPGGEHAREGDEERAARGEQPDLVPVPEGADGRQHLPALGVAPRDEQVEGAGAEVEAVEHDVGGEHRGGDGEPQLSHGAPRPGRRDRRGRPSLERVRSVGDLAPDQEEEQHAEHEVEAGEADQREQGRAGVHAWGSRRRRCA